MERLATHLEKSRKLRSKLLSALIYPAVLAVVALIVVVLLLIFVVPAVVEQFQTVGQDLPALTNAVIGVSDFMRSWGLIVVPAIGLGIWLLRGVFRTPAVKIGWDKFVLRLPLLGKTSRHGGTAQEPGPAQERAGIGSGGLRDDACQEVQLYFSSRRRG